MVVIKVEENMVKSKSLGCVLSAAIVSLTLAAAPVLPISGYLGGSASALTEAGEVETLTELLGAVAEGGTVRLANDITREATDAQIIVAAGKSVVLDLNGHTLSLLTNGARGMSNNGSLTITGNGTITDGPEITEAWGLIDNYGTLLIENGTFLDYGQGGGAALKNRPGASMTINNSEIHGYAEAGGNACVYSEGTLVVGDGVVMTNLATDEMYTDAYNDSYFGAYALIVANGTATFGTTVGPTDGQVLVDGNRGAVAVNGGALVVNNGAYYGRKYYGMWITNNGNVSNVDIKYAESYGAKYGLYSSVDDGKQDLSDVGITIAGGKFAGGTKAAVAVNASKSEHSFGMAITGGEFSTEPDSSYLAENYVAGLTEDVDYPYMVVSGIDESDEYDIEYEEDEKGEEVPVIYPSKVDWGEDGSAQEVLYDGEHAVKLAVGKELIVDRKAELTIDVKDDLSGFKLASGGELFGAIELKVMDRNNEEVTVTGNDLTISIDVDEKTYNTLAGYDKVEVVYFDEDGNESERLAAELKHEGDHYWIEFKTTHLSTYGVVGVNEEEETETETEAASTPETGTMTAAGASAVSAALVTAITVGLLVSIASFAYLIRRK